LSHNARIGGLARVDKKTKNLIPRLHPGDIAIIDHADLDEVAALGLVEAKVKAVVNAAASISGRYPNQGPLLLAERGIPLIDQAGEQVMEAVKDGEEVFLIGPEIHTAGGLVASGRLLDKESITALLEQARANLMSEAEKFIDNTLTYAQAEKKYFIADLDLPPLRVNMRGRQVLVVVRGKSYREDLRAVDPYIQEMHPLLVGVDGGADALLDAGYKPDLIIGDMDSVSERALKCGAELVVHAYLDGRSPGYERLQALGLPCTVIAAPGTSEDLALLVAYQMGAELIVAVGTHSNMIDFLEKGRPGMASTFLVRLKTGSIVVDAKGVSKLYQGRPKHRYWLQVVIAALVPIFLVGMLSGYPRQWLRLIALSLRMALGW